MGMLWQEVLLVYFQVLSHNLYTESDEIQTASIRRVKLGGRSRNHEC